MRTEEEIKRAIKDFKRESQGKISKLHKEYLDGAIWALKWVLKKG